MANEIRKPQTGTPPLVAFCLHLDRFWRQPLESPILTATDFREALFPYDRDRAEDRIFRYLSPSDRGKVLHNWSICGRRTAEQSTNEEIVAIVHRAFKYSDLDDAVFASGLTSELVIGFSQLDHWWRFWRSGRHHKLSLQAVFTKAYELELFDAAWFLGSVTAKKGKLRGVDAIAASLKMDGLAKWLTAVHGAIIRDGKATEKTFLEALSLETIVAKMDVEDMLALVDELSGKLGLANAPEKPQSEPTPPKPPTFFDTSIKPSDAEVEAAVTQLGADARKSAEAEKPAPVDVAKEAEPAEPGTTRKSIEPPSLEFGGGDDASIDDPEIVDEADLLAAAAVGPASTGGQRVMTGTGSAMIDWGSYPVDPAKSASDAINRSGDSSHSSSSLNRVPRPDAQRASDLTTPTVPPPRKAGPPPLPLPPPKPEEK